MQEKRKKFWIIFSVTILAILSFSLIFGMITNLKNVNVEFRQRVVNGSRLEDNILEKIKEDGQFEYNKGLLFIDAKKSMARIEKDNPFVKVEQVIREFPNSLNVYISERVPCNYAKSGEYYVVLDKEFKVLDKVRADAQGEEYLNQNYLSNIYEIDYDLEQFNLQAGDFVSDNGNMQIYKKIYSGIIGALESVSSVKSIKIKDGSVEIVMKKDNITYDDGVMVRLKGIDDLTLKTFTAIEFFETIDKTKSAQVIEVEKIDGTNKYRAYIIGA